MEQCSHCNHEIKPDTKFCGYCGAPVELAASIENAAPPQSSGYQQPPAPPQPQQPVQGGYQQPPTPPQQPVQGGYPPQPPMQGGQPPYVASQPKPDKKSGTNLILFIVIGIVVLGLIGTGVFLLTRGSGKVDTNILGTWNGVEAEFLGIEASVENAIGGSAIIDFKEDKTCDIHYAEETLEGKWKSKGKKVEIIGERDGAEYKSSGTIDGDTMVIKNMVGTGIKITFEKGAGKTVDPDPLDTATPQDVGYYVIDSIIMDGGVFDSQLIGEMGMDYYLELREDHTATIYTDILLEGTWKDGKLHYQEDGENVSNDYALDGDTLTIDLSDDGGEMIYVFKRSSKDVAFTKPVAGEDQAESGFQQLWGGAWYGYIWFTEDLGGWGAVEDLTSNIYTIIEVDDDGKGTMDIYFENYDVPSISADIMAYDNHFEVTKGVLWDADLDTDAWWLALSPVNDEGKLLVVNDEYLDPSPGNEGFEYMIYMRPFGDRWISEEDAGDKLPPNYDDYIAALDQGVTDPNAWRANSEVEEEPADTPTGGGEVTPYFTAAELKDIYKKLDQAYDNFSLREMTYEDVRDTFFNGVEGGIDDETGYMTYYRWRAKDNNNAYIMVIFEDFKEDGIKRGTGISSEFP